jgi:hypothetical protein
MNPETIIELEEGAHMELETSQIGGIDDTLRITRAKLAEGSSIVIHDKILTDGDQKAKAELAALIKAEDPKKPLSDQKLCELLKEKKMDISRRTVMKYREQLGYPSSVKRKRY